MTPEHFDVLVVGAGISGVGAAYHLQTKCPNRTYAVLEGRADMGGTWDLFRYPGIRSDSDMFTLGYPFRPWPHARSIADGSSILGYIKDTADAFGIDKRIRFGHMVKSAQWLSSDARWSVSCEVDGNVRTYTCNFLYLCSGYYSYQSGFTPEIPGIDRFAGPVVHPQAWPENLDYANKNVVVIGSGATAITLVPAMADTAKHVTMLQRSPAFIASKPSQDAVASSLRKFLPIDLAHRIVRWKSILTGRLSYSLCRRFPTAAAQILKDGVSKNLDGKIAVDPHFTPRYKPWDQRICLTPDGDLFQAFTSGRASVVTDRIDTVAEAGITLVSGAELNADIIVTATGLKMVAVGGIELSVDGELIDPSQSYLYKGSMLSGVPNLAWCLGYTNASWTLKADLSSRYVCRLLNHLDANGFEYAVPITDGTVTEEQSVLGLEAGYVLRASEQLPKQGAEMPWRVRQNYLADAFSAKFGALDDSMEFGRTN